MVCGIGRWPARRAAGIGGGIQVHIGTRILEQEGLIFVKRGRNGGYFASRPGLDTVEAIASSYLQSIDVNQKNVNIIAQVLWTEVVREAAQLQTEASRALARQWMKQITGIPKGTPFLKIIEWEQQLRTAIFALIDARYVEMIFHLNTTLGRRGALAAQAQFDESQLDVFLRNWRGAKLGELQAIIGRDCELASISARHSANVLQNSYLP